MRQAQLADLTVHIAGGIDRQGGGDGPVVVLLHGFGARGDDLCQLHRVMDVPRELRFVFPEATLAPRELADYGGRAWWMIDTVAMQQSVATGRSRDRSDETPAGMAEAHARVTALLDAVQHELSAQPEQIVLGGFSQGAMLSCDVALRSERKLAGLVLLSTTLLCRRDWQPRMAARHELPIFQSHGRADPLLPFAVATELRDLFRAAGCNVDWHEFNGGHELSMDVLQALAKFLRGCFGSADQHPR
jgi:phospholipase/carboxylesterase